VTQPIGFKSIAALAGKIFTIYFSVSETPLDKSSQRELALKLLDYALEQEYGVKCGEITRNEYGKPYFSPKSPISTSEAELSDIHFNYSHCKYGVACVVAKEEVGVDIQEIKAVNPLVIKRVCCANELEMLKKEDACSIHDRFIKIWAQKEAYAKFTGKGFAEGFRQIDTTAFPPELVFKRGNMYIACYAKTLINRG
jgi:4'-phosphopantetheinyl transferase